MSQRVVDADALDEHRPAPAMTASCSWARIAHRSRPSSVPWGRRPVPPRAVLTMLADTMMPEAFEHGGKLTGVITTLGFAVAFTIHTLD
jgi:hypothetical protein